jgi:hypothetical protein
MPQDCAFIRKLPDLPCLKVMQPLVEQRLKDDTDPPLISGNNTSRSGERSWPWPAVRSGMGPCQCEAHIARHPTQETRPAPVRMQAASWKIDAPRESAILTDLPQAPPGDSGQILARQAGAARTPARAIACSTKPSSCRPPSRRAVRTQAARRMPVPSVSTVSRQTFHAAALMRCRAAFWPSGVVRSTPAG